MDFVEERSRVEVDDGFWQDGTLIIDGSELKTILEGLQVEFLE